MKQYLGEWLLFEVREFTDNINIELSRYNSNGDFLNTEEVTLLEEIGDLDSTCADTKFITGTSSLDGTPAYAFQDIDFDYGTKDRINSRIWNVNNFQASGVDPGIWDTSEIVGGLRTGIYPDRGVLCRTTGSSQSDPSLRSFITQSVTQVSQGQEFRYTFRLSSWANDEIDVVAINATLEITSGVGASLFWYNGSTWQNTQKFFFFQPPYDERFIDLPPLPNNGSLNFIWRSNFNGPLGDVTQYGYILEKSDVNVLVDNSTELPLREEFTITNPQQQDFEPPVRDIIIGDLPDVGENTDISFLNGTRLDTSGTPTKLWQRNNQGVKRRLLLLYNEWVGGTSGLKMLPRRRLNTDLRSSTLDNLKVIAHVRQLPIRMMFNGGTFDALRDVWSTEWLEIGDYTQPQDWLLKIDDTFFLKSSASNFVFIERANNFGEVGNLSEDDLLVIQKDGESMAKKVKLSNIDTSSSDVRKGRVVTTQDPVTINFDPFGSEQYAAILSVTSLWGRVGYKVEKQDGSMIVTLDGSGDEFTIDYRLFFTNRVAAFSDGFSDGFEI